MKFRAGVFFVFIGMSLVGRTATAITGGAMSVRKAIFHLEAERLLLNDRFDTVDSLYAAFTQTYPDDPAGYLFQAGALLAKMSDREERLYEKRFKALLDTVNLLVQRELDSTDAFSRSWLFLWRGHARAYRSLYESKFGSFLSALKKGLKSRGDYNASLAADSQRYDAYFGLGSYHYWKSAKAGVLRFLGLFRNEKDKGIRELKLAGDSSLLSRQAAHSALIWVYLDRKRYDSAVALAAQMASSYPEGNSFLWPLAEGLFKTKQYDSAVSVWRRLRERLNSQPGNYYNLIEVDYNICRALEKSKKRELLAAEAARSQEYRRFIPLETRTRQADKLAYLRRMLN